MTHPYQPSEKPALPLSYYCNKCGHYGDVGPTHVRPDGAACDYLAASLGPYFTASQLAAEVERAVAAERARCVRVCRDEAAMRRSAGDMHDEDSESRSRCMAGARAALNCAVGCESGEIV